MERRQFLKSTAIGSTCLLAGTLFAENTMANDYKPATTLKITILKKSINQEWYKEFRKKEGNACDIFTEGQEFILKSAWEAPEGFCHWAWADIRTFIHLVNEGKFETFVSCCSDGFRPVFFKIEKIKS